MQKENKFFSFHFRVHGKFDASQSYEKNERNAKYNCIFSGIFR